MYSPALERQYSTEELFYEKEMKAPPRRKNYSLKRKEASYDDEEEDYDSGSDEYRAPSINVMTTRVETAMGSATYHIPRACSVAADNKPHKVSHIRQIQIRSSEPFLLRNILLLLWWISSCIILIVNG